MSHSDESLYHPTRFLEFTKQAAWMEGRRGVVTYSNLFLESIRIEWLHHAQPKHVKKEEVEEKGLEKKEGQWEKEANECW